MLLAQSFPRRHGHSAFFHQPPFPHPILIPQPQTISQPQSTQTWFLTSTSSASTVQPLYTPTTNNNIYSFGESDQPLFDFVPEQLSSCQSQSLPLMQPEQSNNSWLSNGQLTPHSATRSHHHRESSLSSLGSAGPASPYTPNTSHPAIAGDFYDGFADYQSHSSKPLTPAHTPVTQEQFLTSYHQSFYNNLAFTMGNEGMARQLSDSVLMPAPEFSNHSDRPAMTSTTGNDSPNTPSTTAEERRKPAYISTVPKLDRTMTDVYGDELYNPSFQFTSAPPTTTPPTSATLSPQNDVFTQRLQAANSQHLTANTQTPLTIPARDRSPFRQGSPLAPSTSAFESQSRFGTASQMRERQKAENDVRVLQQQIARGSSEDGEAKTISPKDVDLVYHENEEDSATPLFPVKQEQQSPTYRRTATKTETSESDLSEKSHRSMATYRRESSSSYPTSSQGQQQSSFNIVPPAIPGSVRQVPQHYPFVPHQRRQTSNVSNMSEEFPTTLTSMESSSSEYAPDSSDAQKPSGTSAETGTYTCTYHGCTLRFETPAKLQKHKREGHRSSASLAGVDPAGMTSSSHKPATQAGPHKCESINPSTGKPCNTIFSRPYDLTRHEDTIHNARKKKVRCHLCTEEKTFSRNDALTRHFRVCHPDVDFQGKRMEGNAITG